ncbi:hypothetical protein, partial [Kaarinaea lacus]
MGSAFYTTLSAADLAATSAAEIIPPGTQNITLNPLSLWIVISAVAGFGCLAYLLFRQKRNNSSQPHALESQWLNAIEFIDEPMVLVDMHDRIIRANRAYYQSTGKSADTVTGAPASQYCHPPQTLSCPI